MSRVLLYWAFMRPFTLAPPAVGMLSGAATAYFVDPPVALDGALVARVLIGSLVGGLLNGASNGLNQIHDLDLDRINKPERLLVTGDLGVVEARRLVSTGYALSLALAMWVGAAYFILATLAAVATYLYSVPPFRTKRFTYLANLTIAIPRGVLLKVAGWATVRPPDSFEPWYIGTIFGAFLLGAASTKDFSDMKGDGANGCLTLPVRFGPIRAAWMVAPFFVWPFLLIPLGVYLGILSGDPGRLNFLGFGLSAWGLYAAWLMIRKPQELAETENHPSWTHMYLMMMVCQIGFAVAYYR